MLTTSNGRAISESNPLPQKVTESTIIQPVDIQARYAQTIQTHNAVSVGASGSSSGAWVDCSGFSDLAITFLNDASTTSFADINWSHDGVAHHSSESGVLTSSTLSRKAVQLPIKARYARLVLANSDTVAHIMSAWFYLKA